MRENNKRDLRKFNKKKSKGIKKIYKIRGRGCRKESMKLTVMYRLEPVKS